MLLKGPFLLLTIKAWVNLGQHELKCFLIMVMVTTIQKSCMHEVILNSLFMCLQSCTRNIQYNHEHGGTV